jgi:hypothetical protein
MTAVKPDDPESDLEPDPELARLLREWTVPAVPDSLDRRVTALYRARIARRPLWERLFRAEVRVPLPVAVALLAALLVAVWAPWRDTTPVESVESGPPARTAGLDPRPSFVPRPSVGGGAHGPSLAGFEPVSEMNVTVVPLGGTP